MNAVASSLVTLLSYGSLGLGPPVSYWIHGGENRETVVLIHGFNSSHETWNTLLPELSERYQVIVYDQPGHGESKARGNDFSPSSMARELKALLDYLIIKEAHIVGHSMGGRTAVAFGAEYPSMTKSILVEDMGMNLVPEALKILPSALSRFQTIQENVPDSFPNQAELVSTLSQYLGPEEIPWVLASAKKNPNGGVKLGNRPEVTMLYLYQGLALDMKKELKSLEMPLQFFAADPKSQTAVLKGIAVEHLKFVRPDVTVEVFEGAGHRIHGSHKYTDALFKHLQTF